MTDRSAARRIAALACSPEEENVVEIGPGTGVLTAALLQAGARVTAVEIDADMIAVLRSQPELGAAALVHADALQFDYAAIAREGPWAVTGNLPYNVATPLLMQLIEMAQGPGRMVVMVQREVADRLRARPGTRAYGSLSVAVQYAMSVERAFSLPPSAFYPRPKVDSSVVRLVRRPERAVRVGDERRFLQVVRAAFAYRRKTLANSLSLALGLDRRVVTEALLGCGLDTDSRGEQLSLADFAKLSDRLNAGTPI